MTLRSNIREKLGPEWLPDIYREKVRSQRTRSFTFDIPQKENRVEIQYTLLGIELKVGKKRFTCPDLATARYMQVFARIGCRQFAIPYDITQTTPLADQLETAWQKLLLIISNGIELPSSSSASRSRSSMITDVRNELNQIGPGDVMPEFTPSTKQRKQ